MVTNADGRTPEHIKKVRTKISPEDVLNLIKTRRTVRKFDPEKPVGNESLNRILEAGTWAPYGPYFPQGWKFIAVKGAKREQIISIVTKSQTVLKYLRTQYETAPWAAEAESKAEHETKEFAKEFGHTLGRAPVTILALVPYSESLAVRGHNMGSAWAAAQNMMLQAQAEGLNSGVITFHSPAVQHKLTEVLELSGDEWMVVYLLNIGYGIESPEAPHRKEGLSEIRE